MNLFDRIHEIGIVPVIAIEDVHHAVRLADALLEGGLPVAEITFRTSAAAEVMALLRDERPELLVGAGTVLDDASLTAAYGSGARFGLAPGFDPQIVKAAQAMDLAFAPGVMTPSELGAAMRLGSRIFKFFPAGTAGGPAALEGMSTPFAHLRPRFIPTGGVTEENIPRWLEVASVLAVGGTWIARTGDIRHERWPDITRNARRAVNRVREARGG